MRIFCCAVGTAMMSATDRAVRHKPRRVFHETVLLETTSYLQKTASYLQETTSYDTDHPRSISGSAQEFVESRISGCFLKNDEFCFCDRHALRLEQQIAEILVAPAPSKKGFDVAVDGFHHSEAYLGAAVVEDSI
jgi:hypothetical protein